MGRGSSKGRNGIGGGGMVNLPRDWKEYAESEIDNFSAGTSMNFPTPKGNLIVSIYNNTMGFTNNSGEFVFEGIVTNMATGQVLYNGTLPMNQLRKRIKKAVTG